MASPAMPRKADARNVRRYLTIVQDARGYPGPNARRDLAPPDGPAEPVVHSVVLGDDFEDLEVRYLAVVRALRQAGADFGAAATAFRKLDEGTGYPPHVAQADAERAKARVLDTLREHVGEND